MCGLAGIWRTPEEKIDPGEAQCVAAMLAHLRHRGPDGGGLSVQGNLALGHRRLALHDLTPAGLQPLISEDGEVVVAVNGTIHNAPELRAREAARGFQFRTHSDSEVLIPLFRRHGVDLLRELQGPFALALCDRRRSTLLLARDRLGKKPLFLTESQGRLVFASEMRALMEALPQRTLQEGAAATFLQAGYIPAPATLLVEARSLPPGHRLLADRHGWRVECWWRPHSLQSQDLDLAGAAARLETGLREAIRLRTRTPRRLGVFLSGGLDSAAVLLLAQEVLERPLPAFTLGFDHARLDERLAAKETAGSLASPHRCFTFDVPPGPYLHRILAATGELLADASLLPTTRLCELAAAEATVFLGGDGGDELLLGYRRHGAARLASARGWRLLGGMMGRAAGALWSQSRIAAAGKALPGGPAGLMADLAGLLPRARLRSILLPGALPDPDPLTARFLDLPAPRDGAEAGGLWDLLTYLPGDLLPKADRASMLHGVEIWSPFLDPLLVQEILRIPGSVRRSRGRGKMPLRHLLHGRLPARTLRRRKRGFGAPLLSWLREGSYGGFARQVLGDVREPFEGILPECSALPLLQRCLQGEDDLAPLVHACVVLALFHDLFLKSGSRK